MPQSQPLRRPLIGLTLAFMAGTGGAILIGGLPPLGVGMAAAGLLTLSLLCQGWLFFAAKRRTTASVFSQAFPVWSRLLSGLGGVSLYLAVIAGGWCAADLRLNDPFPGALASLMERPRESVEVEGIVTDEPSVMSSPDGKRELWRFPLRLEAIHRVIPWQLARGTLEVVLPAAPGRNCPQYGERWRLAGVLIDNARFPEPEEPGQYSGLRIQYSGFSIQDSEVSSRNSAPGMSKPKPAVSGQQSAVSGERSEISNQQSEISNEKWLPGHSVPVATRPVLDWLKQRYTFRADPAAAVCLVPGQGSRLMAACFQLRRKCAAVLARGIEHRPEVAGLLQALLLGYRQELPEKVRNDFVATGTYHIFAISGQHVAILALFIIVILRAYRVSRVRWFLYVTPILLVFTVATGMSSSAVRGCLMALLCFLGPLIGRKPDIPSAMALAALLILGADPFQLFDYGFLLSFVAVSGLIVLCPPLLQRLAPVMEPDELRLQPEPRLVRWARRGLRFVVFLSATSLAAWLVTTPLVARWFNLISPIALLANLIVIPVATLVLLAGCLSIVGGLAVPLLGEIFNFANVVLVSFLLWVTDLMARIPYGHVFVKSPPLWSLPIWYGALAGWILWRRKPWVWLAAPVLLALALATGWVGSRVEVEIDLLNCGDHPVCFVNVPGGDDLLIDPGGRYEARRIIRHLRRQGVDRLRAVLLTGGGNARVGGMADILPAVPVGELWLPPGGGKSKSRQSPADLARERGMDLRCWATGKRLFIPPARRMLGAAETNLDFIVLNAGGNDSLAWRLRRGAFSVLFVQGDSASALAALRELDPESRPTVLVENRLEEEFKPPYRERAAAGIGCAWRIICTRRLFAEDGGEASSGERSLRLPPGQGVRLCLERDRLELEHLEY